MNASECVTVVVPCLNRATYLGPTIESILRQDYPNIECIVIDGGSTDGTLALLENFNGQIKWISEPDNGHADAINKGWQMAQGQILAWLNADDVWVTPDAVSQAIAYLQANPDVDVVYGNCGAIDAAGNLIGMSYLHEWDLEHAVVQCDHCIPQPAAFIRRRILEQVDWLDTVFYQKKDHELWLRIGLIGKICHIPVALAHARHIKGLSQDGLTAAPACVQVTEKFYSLPNVPASLKAKKMRALSNSYLKGMFYAFEGGQLWPIIVKYALLAILKDPTNGIRAIRQLEYFVHRGAVENNQSHRPNSGLKLFSLPGRMLRKIARKVKYGVTQPRWPNLLGDRDVEWSWVAAHIPNGPGAALDFGAGDSYLGLLAAQRGFDTVAVDLQPIHWPYNHPKLRFIQGDIKELPLPRNYFDLIINCSAIEHVGLVGRYGVIEKQPDGDLEAMTRLGDLMKTGGTMLLTVPVGRDAIFAPLCRVYGTERLPRLLSGYEVLHEEFWIKTDQNQWVSCNRDSALDFQAAAGSWNPLKNVYALGCFVLKQG